MRVICDAPGQTCNRLWSYLASISECIVRKKKLMIIFYDWDDPNGEFGPQDGKPDHTGIVERVVDGVVYTIEGNSGDSCIRNEHPVGKKVILGFGVPKY